MSKAAGDSRVGGASLEVLQGQQFEVLLLDEASQLTEPLSLAPVIRWVH